MAMSFRLSGQAVLGNHFRDRPHACRAKPVDVLIEAWIDGTPHRIQDEINAFAPRQLGRRNEVGIAGDENDLVNLSLEGQ